RIDPDHAGAAATTAAAIRCRRAARAADRRGPRTCATVAAVRLHVAAGRCAGAGERGATLLAAAAARTRTTVGTTAFAGAAAIRVQDAAVHDRRRVEHDHAARAATTTT